jgi:serine/threonine protein phosphatase PrpC
MISHNNYHYHQRNKSEIRNHLNSAGNVQLNLLKNENIKNNQNGLNNLNSQIKLSNNSNSNNSNVQKISNNESKSSSNAETSSKNQKVNYNVKPNNPRPNYQASRNSTKISLNNSFSYGKDDFNQKTFKNILRKEFTRNDTLRQVTNSSVNKNVDVIYNNNNKPLQTCNNMSKITSNVNFSKSINQKHNHNPNVLSNKNQTLYKTNCKKNEIQIDSSLVNIIQACNQTIYNPSAKSVKEYSYKEDKNSQHRDAMEDFYKINDKFMGDTTKGFFSLYDGHGGTECVKYAKDRMPEVFAKFLVQTNNNVEKALIFSFQKIDDELKLLSESQNAGTTATIVYVHRENDVILGNRKVLYCANVGDSRCIIMSDNDCKKLSYDHKCSDKEEVSRIKKSGGVVFNERVYGQLALSRALGDHSMKKLGVISTPCIHRHVVAEKDKFVVICSDGVWDVLNEEDIFYYALNTKNADELSNVIVKKALEKGSMDNISCISIKVN